MAQRTEARVSDVRPSWMPAARSTPVALAVAVVAIVAIVAIVAMVVIGGSAQYAFAATPLTLNAQAFEATGAPGDGVMVPSARSASDASALGAQFGYARRALGFSSEADGVRRVQVIFGDLATIDATMSLRRGRWTFEAALPVATVIRGGGPNLLAVDPPLAPVFGDLRLGARWLAYSRAGLPVGDLDVALRALYAAPTAGKGAWLGGSGLQIDLGVIASLRSADVDVDVELALRARPLETLSVVSVDPATGSPRLDNDGQQLRDVVLASGSRLLARGRVARAWGDQRIVSALEGQLQLDIDPGASSGQSLAEGLAVAELPLDRGALRFFAAVGGAATGGWGSPQLRMIAGLRVRPDRMAADRDNDTIDDRDDRCPDVAEDLDGFEDADGCPDLDDDGDGIPDTIDRCRLEAEDKDGYEDADGCPDDDDDGDGVPDAADRCPRVAEDVDGFEDSDGCPDPDNDGDGIADIDDLCPNAAENINNYEDADGCPDIAPAPLVSIAPGRLLLARPLRFLPGSSTLAPAGLPTIAAVIALLRAHKEISALEVAVFLDDAGTIDDRIALTQARAETIKAMLLRGSGLEDHQIRAVGMADKLAIAGNADAEGRSRNRRVEFRILSGPDAVKPLVPLVVPAKSKRPRRR